MEYKRLTFRHKSVDGTEQIGYTEKLVGCYRKEEMILNRLAELEDKIEQGKMIEIYEKLPFKVGDTAYWLNGLPNCIQEYKVVGYSFDCWCGLRVDLDDMQPMLFRCFGVNLFASREEAEKRLLELQGGK